MKKTSRVVPPITDWIVTDMGSTGKYFDTQLRLWVKALSVYKERYYHMYKRHPKKNRAGSPELWEYKFACDYLNKAEKLLKEKNLYFDNEIETTFRELRSMFNKYDNLKTCLLTLRIAMLTVRAGFIPDNSKRGESNVSGGITGGEKSGEIRQEKSKPKKESWQAEADKIWKKHPAWSNRGVAIEIAKRIGGNPETIRKHIKKPLP